MTNNNVIQFGTDGWRSVISDGFTIANVRCVTQAVCAVLRNSAKSRLILIGYDRRFMSEKFALEAARVAEANDFKVEMSDRAISSPVLSSVVKARKAAIGIMITASHNPYQFSGFKLKGPHGGSVDEAFTNKVEAALDPASVITSPVDIKRVDFVSTYLQFLKKLLKIETLAKLKGKVVFDAMNGPGGDILESLVGADAAVVIRKEVDPMFGGGAPEPVERYLSPLKEAVLSHRAMAGFALDGDADRLGVIDDKGRYLPPTLVMPLLLLHLVENRGLKGKVAQTVSMGYLPGRLAASFRLPFEETPVGFKHIAALMNEEKVLLGGEESGGYGVGLWSPERDGLLCALLLVEMMAAKKMPLSALVDDLKKRFGESYFERIDFELPFPVRKMEWTDAIKSQLTSILASQPVRTVRSDDGIKIVTQSDAWVLMRPSGTEPLIRTYAEAADPALVKEFLKEADRLIHVPEAALAGIDPNESKKKSKTPAKKRAVR